MLQKSIIIKILFGVCVFMLLIIFMGNFKDRSSNQINAFLNKEVVDSNSIYCPKIPPNLRGEFELDFEDESLDEVEERLGPLLQSGGWFTPKGCISRYKVAILVPMWNRSHHLPKFLKNIHPMLMRQQIEYGIYVIEQTTNQKFNKGAVYNIGFLNALNMKNWDCFIFHDIDMIPFDDRNLYNCPPEDVTRQLSVSIDKFGYKRIDEVLGEGAFGGVVAFTTKQYSKVNGFSNQFWNWGGEDNDLYNRVKNANYITVQRPSEKVAKYKSLPHKFSNYNPNWKEQITKSQKYFNTSGLNSLQYHIKEIKIRPLFVHIVVDHIHKEEGTLE